MKHRKLYAFMTAGSIVGVIAAFLQTLEKLELLQDANSILPCNINSIFSCTNVLNSWQSSLFGFPNSLMCLMLFTIFATAALAGLAGSTLSKGFRLGVQGLSLFTLGFALWFLQQSTFAIQAICIFCLFCFAGLLVSNWAWLRINAVDLPLRETHKQALLTAIKKDYDILGWLIVSVGVALAMVLQFR